MTKFYNPYHFVPAEKIDKNNKYCKKTTPGTPLHKGTDMGRLDASRYHDGTFSGRLVCTLETKTPTVFGGRQTKDDDGYTRIIPFERENKPAVPATSIKGCISSVAEAASNSALRVLEKDRTYSRRVDMNTDVKKAPEDYSALGMIRLVNGKLKLVPLAMPTLVKKERDKSFVLPEKFSKMFSKPVLKAYYYKNIRNEEMPPTYDSEGLLCYYAKLKGKLGKEGRKNHYRAGSHCHIKSIKYKEILLGCKIEGPILNSKEYKKVPDPKSYTQGIVRTIFTPSREDELPRTKKHEIFLPYPSGDAHEFEIMPKALENFKRLAAESEKENNRRESQFKKGSLILNEKYLPFCLKGDDPFIMRNYELRDLDIVFFRPDITGEKVEEITISQLWRKSYPDGIEDFFSGIDPELLPFHSKREIITPAEALFGFIEEEKESRFPQRALAGRVKISDGQLRNHPGKEPYHPEIPMRILGSPKPPCPSFYFKKKRQVTSANVSTGECYISKNALSKVDYIPQGRKFYLNHKPEQDTRFINNKIKTGHPGENQKQKNKISPLKSGCVFTFHMDFDNLSKWELGMLMYAVRPPFDEFLHKMGMGKALGLGSVELAIAGLFLVDRQTRYSGAALAKDNSIAPRYHESLISKGKGLFCRDYHNRVQKGHGLAREENNATRPSEFIDCFSKTVPPNISLALKKLGKCYPLVLPPLLASQYERGNTEKETFEWFRQNDGKGKKQGLVPLDKGNDICKLEQN